MDKPTSANTKAEIQAYLVAQDIQYSSTATKDELLSLIPADEPVDKPATEEEPPVVPDEGEQLPPVIEPVPTEPEPETSEPAVEPVPESDEHVLKYTKYQLIYLSSFPGMTRDLMQLALVDGKLYTREEALAEVEEFSERLWW